MGVDDEYKMVSSQDEANDHLLERAAPISRSAYKKRSLAASVVVGALVGAGVMFLFSVLFGSPTYTVKQDAEPTKEAIKELAEPISVTTTVTATAPLATVTQVISSIDDPKVQAGVDPAHMTQNGVILDCGHTVEEALAKDCVFDVMMQDWMPRPCYDEVLSERYLAQGNWTWWADVEASRAIPLEEMRTGQHPVIYVIQDYHKSHCIYAWEKMVRALRNDWPLITELISYDHVMHCRHSTLSKEAESVKGVRAPTAWVQCALYKDWQGNFPDNSHSSIEKRTLEQREPWDLW